MSKSMKFAEVVRSPTAVRSAFNGAGAWSLWCRTILALHGKPEIRNEITAESHLTLTRGFRFYASLYALLAATLLLAALIVASSGLPNLLFLFSVLCGASIYLAATSRLGFVGSRNYLLRESVGSVQLVTFFVSIIAFLACFCGCSATIVHLAFPMHDFAILAITAPLLILGVGSYCIEIVFLVTDLGSTKLENRGSISDTELTLLADRPS